MYSNKLLLKSLVNNNKSHQVMGKKRMKIIKVYNYKKKCSFLMIWQQLYRKTLEDIFYVSN